mgnify:CR=1 FL=1
MDEDGVPRERRVSAFVGVCWNFRVKKWAAQSRVAGKTIYLGYFENEEEAARKYDAHANGLSRPVNFPSGTQMQAHKCALRFLKRPRGDPEPLPLALVPTPTQENTEETMTSENADKELAHKE